MLSAKMIERIGRVPLVGSTLRWFARRYPENSVVTIKHGEAAGLRWRRHHRYLNGYWIGQYELPIQAALKRELRFGDTFFDVGANAGFFTLVASRLVGPTGKCVAFDPLPVNVESIREQLELNDLKHCHWDGRALSDEPESSEFSVSSGDTARGALGHGGPDADTHITVTVTTLDAAAERWGQPNFIKLDVEGAEGKVLEGSTQTIAEAHPTWLIEIHTPECEFAVRETLAAAGYRFFEIDGKAIPEGSPLQHHVLARHSSR